MEIVKVIKVDEVMMDGRAQSRGDKLTLCHRLVRGVAHCHLWLRVCVNEPPMNHVIEIEVNHVHEQEL